MQPSLALSSKLHKVIVCLPATKRDQSEYTGTRSGDNAMDATEVKSQAQGAARETSELEDSSRASIDESRGEEQQPFLKQEEDDDASAKPPRESCFDKRRLWTLFLPLAIVFLLAVGGLAFGITYIVKAKAAKASHHVSGHNVSEHTIAPNVIQFHEKIPGAAQLRDPDEYILSPSWNYKHAPVTREYHWTIASATLNPDGVFRPMLLINNQYPGPLIECNEGDTIVVHVRNNAPNATAIHFHGMLQKGTNEMDGTVGMTQCPIAPDSTFTYRFKAEGQSGTYWYHAHHSAQASDGLLGPMVIHSPRERQLQELDYATDRIVMVQDHYHNLTSDLLMEYLAPDQENNEPVPDNALINGRGVRDCGDFPGWQCDTKNVSTPVIDLAANKRHRLRIINVGAFAEFQIQFDEHPFYVTEVDGTDVHPEPFHRLNILPAQRYSVVIEANSTTRSDFWMRARMVTHCFTKENPYLQDELKAIIRYTPTESKQPVQEPTSKEWPDAIEVICRDLNTTALHPVVPISPPPADDTVILRANFEIGAWRLARGFFNESTWHGNATSPSLHRFIDSAEKLDVSTPSIHANEQTFDRKNEFVLQTTGVRTVDFVINNFDDGAHPFHLHGHKFFVLIQGSSGYPPSPDELPQYLKDRGLSENPLRRDTVTVEGYGWAIIRVVLDNAGLWSLHCHNTWHAEAGMVMQLLVQPEVVKNWKIDPVQREMCQRKGIESGMRPSDDIWVGSF